MNVPTGPILNIAPHVKNPEWRVVTIGDQGFLVFSAKAAEGLEVGKPLPEGTTAEDPKFDGALPSLRIPWKKSGAGPSGAWRNTREGEQFNADQMNRRTALMQAIEFGRIAKEPQDFEVLGTGKFSFIFEPATILQIAAEFHHWLESAEISASVLGHAQAVEGPGRGTKVTGEGTERSPGPSAHSSGTENPDGGESGDVTPGGLLGGPVAVQEGQGRTANAPASALDSPATPEQLDLLKLRLGGVSKATKEAQKQFGVAFLGQLTSAQAEQLMGEVA